MPRKNETIRPQKEITKAVKRHLEGGESVIPLAKEHKVSRATFYNWVAAYRAELLEQANKQGMTAHDAKVADKQTLLAEIAQLKSENARLRNKVVALMIKAGEI